MKVKRNKRNRKFLQFYATSYGIKPPYKVVLDGPYLQAALEGKIKILEQIPKLLQAPNETVIMVTKCCIHDLKQKGDFYRGAVMIGSSLKHARCNHEGVIEPGECIKLLIKGGNPDHLFIGAQEVVLRHFVRAAPGVPLLFISGQVPILEPPAESDKKQIVEERTQHTLLSAEEREALKALQPPKTTVYKRKKVKAPNPLSVKKKKKPAQPPTQKPSATQKPSGGPASQDQPPTSVSSDAKISETAPTTTTPETATTSTKKKRRKRRKTGASEGNADQTNTEKTAPQAESSIPQAASNNVGVDHTKPKRKRRKRTKSDNSGAEESSPTAVVSPSPANSSAPTPDVPTGPKNRKRTRKSKEQPAIAT